MPDNESDKATRVLVVEDDPHQREIYSTLLYYNGYDVKEAGSMFEAVDRIAQQKPDIILLDVVLPDANGLEAAKLMSQVPATAGIPIICMTAHDVEPRRAEASGCAELLQKPVDGAILVEAIGRALNEE